MSGETETLMTNKSLVESVIPNLRNDSAIYVCISSGFGGKPVAHSRMQRTLFVGFNENTISECTL